MRRFGLAVLGFLGGLVVGFLLTEAIVVIAVFGVGGGQLPDSLLLALLFRSLTPALALAGVVLAFAIDSRTRGSDGSSQDWAPARAFVPMFAAVTARAALDLYPRR
jgi:hypothetical protein